MTSAGCGVPATAHWHIVGARVVERHRVAVVEDGVHVVGLPVFDAPSTSQMFAAPSPFQMSDRGVMTILTSGVALASGEFGLSPLRLVEVTT